MKGFPLQIPYTAAKHGVVGLTIALANELAAQSVRVNSVHPTGTPTGMVPPSFGATLGEERPDRQRTACWNQLSFVKGAWRVDAYDQKPGDPG